MDLSMPVPAVPAVLARGLCWPGSVRNSALRSSNSSSTTPTPTLPLTVLAYGGRAVQRVVPMNVSH